MYHNSNRRSPHQNNWKQRGGRFRPRPRFRSRSSFATQSIDTSLFVKKAIVQKEAPIDAVTIGFADLALKPEIQTAIAQRDYKTPTPIQAKAIPHILAGKDFIGIANTGTGKTGAFVLPLIQKVIINPNERILVLVPTRELGVQIKEEIFGFSRGMKIYSTLCIGGRFKRDQIYELKRDPHFVIATPGRLKDLISMRVIDLARFHTVVLDEVDRMVDMGFIRDITEILSQLPSKRQSLCFSATISPKVQTIVERFLKDPITISVKLQTTAENIDQDVVRVEQGQTKMQVLDGLLRQKDFDKVLIFGRTKRIVEKLSIELNDRGFKAASIHGNKQQRQRERALTAFRNHLCTILVATDVAARGIDVPNITHVINFDPPATYDDYVHRIGRTGRGNKKGHALTFI